MKKNLVERKDGRVLRRMTLYFPPDVAKRLAIYCIRNNLDMSEFATDVVDNELAARKA